MTKSKIKVKLLKYFQKITGYKNVLFIWIPKTGGTTIYELLDIYNAKKYLKIDSIKNKFNNEGIVTFGHISYSKLLDANLVNDKFDKNSFKFTFVRNPYSRMVSLFFYLKKMKIVSLDLSFCEFCKRATTSQPIGLFNVKNFSQCNRQVEWIRNTKIDFIGKFENMSQDWSKLASHIQCYKHHPIPHKNSTNHEHYSFYYDKTSLEYVNGYYKEDFQTFGYTIKTLDQLKNSK